ncbi:MAG: TIGR04219 family outer membrane beta-barrel protein [Agarilytica sp.]
MKTTHIIFYLTCLSVIPTQLHAKELLGLHLGVDYWDASIKGHVRSDPFEPSEGEPTVTGTLFSAAEFDIAEETLNTYTITLNHDFPGLPKLIYRNAPIKSEGTSVLTLRDVNFAGNTFVTSTNMQSKYELSFQDVSLYYNVKEGWLDLDLGLTQRNIKGAVELRTDDVADTGETGEETTTTDTGPTVSRAKIEKSPILLYAKVHIDIPKTPVSVSSTWQYGESSDDNFNDTEYALAYATESRNYTFRIEGGYKRSHFFSDDLGELGSTLKVRGPFLRLTFGL